MYQIRFFERGQIRFLKDQIRFFEEKIRFFKMDKTRFFSKWKDQTRFFPKRTKPGSSEQKLVKIRFFIFETKKPCGP